MRIIGGTFKGKPLHSPKGNRVRPTSDMVREALFDILQVRTEGVRFLDLYGGTGAVGLEAWSRGAGRVVIVEPHHVGLVCKNCVRLGLAVSSHLHVIRGAAQQAMTTMKAHGELFDIIFADPPWSEGLAPSVVKLAGDLLDDDGLLIIESSVKTDPPAPDPGCHLALTDSRRYGDTALHFYQKQPGSLSD